MKPTLAISSALACCSAFALALTLAGCSDPTSPNVALNTADTSANQTESTQGRRFTIPGEYVDGLSDDDAKDKLASQGATDIVKNADGTYTVTMTNDAFNNFVANNKTQTQNALQALVDNSTYPGITRVTASENFDTIDITTTNADATDSEKNAGDYAVYLACLYQTIAGIPLSCHVTFTNVAGTQIYERTYP